MNIPKELEYISPNKLFLVDPAMAAFAETQFGQIAELEETPTGVVGFLLQINMGFKEFSSLYRQAQGSLFRFNKAVKLLINRRKSYLESNGGGQ